MSLEQSMQDLAASNLELAAAMRNYAGVMQSIASSKPTELVAPTATDATDATPETPAMRKRRTKAEIEADAKAEADALRASQGADAGEEEADPFADEEPAAPKAITKDDVRTLILAVKNTKGDDVAKKLLEKLGVKTLGTITEKDYPKVVELCGKVGVTL